MTYLQMINEVLKRLRENTVTTVTDTDYAQLVGYFINDAKRLVQTAWDWSGLRSTETVNAVAGTNSYTLTGLGVDFKVLDAYNDTQNTRLHPITQNEMNNKIKLNDAASSAPYFFCYNGVDASGDQKILITPTPDASYTLNFDVIKREPDLSSDSDATALPTYPILMYAWAMAARERGETGGTSAAELFGLGDRALADAVALEAHRYGAETTWDWQTY